MNRVHRRRRRRNVRVIVTSVIALVVLTASIAVAAARPWDDAEGASASAGSSTSSSAPSTTTTTEPAVVGPYSKVIQAENQKPGTINWRVGKTGPQGALQGYASAPSVQRGEHVTLYVSTTTPGFQVEAYRMGWYQGLGARLVWTSPPVVGQEQSAPTVIAATNTAEARWQPTLDVAIDDQWVPGDYLLKLVATTGEQRWIPLTVRDDSSKAPYVIMNAVTTWQAYNRWGGCSLYDCGGAGGRAKVVSFDRPYDMQAQGSGDFVGNELPLVMRAEQLGLDVTYITSVDLQARPELLTRHRALFSLGHDEYWSKAMRDGTEAARDAGVNLAFLGANAVFRQIRFEASPLGPNRRIVNYRSTSDPIRATDPSQTTVSWRESPVNRPEASLIGEQYECNPVRADMVVTDPGAWVWAGTGVTQGQHLDVVVGSEYDRFFPALGPDNVQVLAHSPVQCHSRSSWSDMTYYSAPSGAGVLATGTNYWVSKLTPPEWEHSPYNAVVTKATENVLLAFGAGPAGLAHPSTANWQGLPGIARP
jgi:hypothetical protein